MTDCKHIDTMVEKILERPNYEHTVDCDVCASSIPASVSTVLNADFTQQYLPIAQSSQALETFQDSVEKKYGINLATVPPEVALGFDFEDNTERNQSQVKDFKERMFLAERGKYHLFKSMLVRLTQLVVAHLPQNHPLVYRHLSDMKTALQSLCKSKPGKCAVVQEILGLTEEFRTEFDLAYGKSSA